MKTTQCEQTGYFRCRVCLKQCFNNEVKEVKVLRGFRISKNSPHRGIVPRQAEKMV